MTLLVLLLAFYFINGFFDLFVKLAVFLLVLPFVLVGVIFAIARFMISLLFIFSASPAESPHPAQKTRETNTEPTSSGLQLQWTDNPHR